MNLDRATAAIPKLIAGPDERASTVSALVPHLLEVRAIEDAEPLKLPPLPVSR